MRVKRGAADFLAATARKFSLESQHCRAEICNENVDVLENFQTAQFLCYQNESFWDYSPLHGLHFEKNFISLGILGAEEWTSQ